MLAFSEIIDFLLRLLSDEAARAQFEQDPQGTLEQAGLEGVTAQDIRDARLQLADSGGVSALDDGSASSQGGSRYPDGDDPVREIDYTTRHFVADDDVNVVDRGSTAVTVDDRDTFFFQTFSDDDVTVTDNSVTFSNSFNEDNSEVTAVQVTDSFNSDDDVEIDAENSFNTDDDVVAIQDNDVNGGDEVIDVDIDGQPAAPPADPDDADDADEPPPADLDAVSGPAEADAGGEEPATDPEDLAAGDDSGDEAGDLAADDSDALAV